MICIPMLYKITQFFLTFAFSFSLLVCALTLSARAQSGQDTPMTNQEFVRLLYQLPKHPETKDALVEEVRRRGINFPLTDGLRSLVATKSGNDALLRRTMEEAERRRQNPSSFRLPSEAEGNEVL